VSISVVFTVPSFLNSLRIISLLLPKAGILMNGGHHLIGIEVIALYHFWAI
jgi:hypothetical protein